jgi:tetratricopeptide (TPR) repeat protein
MAGVALLTLACGGGVDHERLGDAALAEGDYLLALQEYRAATDDQPEAGTWIKLAAAAYRTGAYREAVEGYGRAAALDRTRLDETARGLALVAAAAQRDGDAAGLKVAVQALRLVAPERVRPRQTLALYGGGELDPAEAAGLGPLALAAAGDAAATDQTLLGYADALRKTTACAEALSVYQTVLRRSRDRQLRQRASDGLAPCGLQLGTDALLLGQPESAADWFAEVAALDSTSPSGRRALIGMGDALVLGGDTIAGLAAYRAALHPGGEDSLRTIAENRLERLENRMTADSL